MDWRAGSTPIRASGTLIRVGPLRETRQQAYLVDYDGTIYLECRESFLVSSIRCKTGAASAYGHEGLTCERMLAARQGMHK
jgi:hypothetical protein